jgi:lysophospholipid acyltransferase (LPLAT)-like uncharacterized protein
VTADREQKKVRRWAARFGPIVIGMLARTWRVAAVNTRSIEALRDRSQPFIFAFWHAHMLPLVWQHREERVAVLISTHADGEIIARICDALGYRTIRGSTSRGGARALVEITRTLERGIEVAITPDGPRGPPRSIAPGVLYAAQRAKAPIVPIYVHASRAWHLATWDSFMIPKPFARLTIRYGEPLFVATGDGGPTLDEESERLGSAFNALASGGD